MSTAPEAARGEPDRPMGTDGAGMNGADGGGKADLPPNREAWWAAATTIVAATALVLFWFFEVGAFRGPVVMHPWRNRDGLVARATPSMSEACPWQPDAGSVAAAGVGQRFGATKGTDCDRFCKAGICVLENVVCRSFSPRAGSVSGIEARSVVFEQELSLNGAKSVKIDVADSELQGGFSLEDGKATSLSFEGTISKKKFSLARSTVEELSIVKSTFLRGDQDAQQAPELSVENATIDDVTIEQSRFEGLVSFDMAKLRQLDVKSSDFLEGFSAQNAKVDGDVNLYDDVERADEVQLEHSSDGVQRSGCPSSEFTAEPARARTTVRKTLNLRGLSSKTLTLQGSRIEQGTLDAVHTEGLLDLKFATFESLSVTGIRVGVLEAFHLTARKLNSFAASVDFNARFQCSNIDAAYLEWFSAGGALSFEHSRVKKLALYHLRTPRLAVGGAEMTEVFLGGSELKSLDLTGAALGELNFGVAKVGTVYLEGFTGGWRTDNVLVEHFADNAEITRATLDVMTTPDATRQTLKPMYSAVEKALRDSGRIREANSYHLATSRLFCTPNDLPPLLVLQGVGHPLWYVLLIAFFVSLGVWVAFRRRRDGKLPVFVYWNPPETKSRTEQHAPPDYHAWVMSLATFLPGDVLGYLRSYTSHPRTTWGALGITAFQLLGLLVQGLLIFAVVSLVR
jgi:uncharacterized protein YjbI with pentapeptide repeats